ncbi:MAG: hypothetical protein ACAH95_11335 [Fimbriimonas sp.]
MSDSKLIASVPAQAIQGIQPANDGSGFFFSTGNRVMFYSLATRSATELYAEGGDFTGVNYLAVSVDQTKAAFSGVRLSDNRNAITIVDLVNHTVFSRIIQAADSSLVQQLAFVNGDTRILASGLKLFALDGTTLATKNTPLTDQFTLNRERTRAFAVDNGNTQTICLDLTTNLGVVWKKGVLGLTASMTCSSDGKVLLDTRSNSSFYFMKCYSTLNGAQLTGQFMPGDGSNISARATAPDKNEIITVVVRGSNILERWSFNTTTGDGSLLNDVSEGISGRVAPMGTPSAPLFAANRSPGYWEVRRPSDGSYTGVFLGNSPGITPFPDKVSPNGLYFIYMGFRPGTSVDWGLHICRTSDLSVVASHVIPDLYDNTDFYGWSGDSRLYTFLYSTKRIRVLKFTGTAVSKVRDFTDTGTTAIGLALEGKRVLAMQSQNETARVYDGDTGILIGTVVLKSSNSYGVQYWGTVGGQLAVHEWVNLGGDLYRNQMSFYDLMQAGFPRIGQPGYEQSFPPYDLGHARPTPDGLMALFTVIPNIPVTDGITPSSLKIIRSSDNVVVRDWTHLPFGPIAHSIMVTPDGTTGIGNGNAAFFAFEIPVAIVGLSLNPTTVNGGQSTTGTITLSNPATSGGTTVTLTGDSGLTLPATVLVPEGSKTATFTVTSSGVDADTVKTVTATLDAFSLTRELTVKAPSEATLVFNPASVEALQQSTGTITVNAVVGASGLVVSLSSNKPCVTVPATVTIPAGQTSVTFTANTSDPSATQVATVTATFGTHSATGNLEVRSPWVITSELSPSPTKGGNALELIVSINPTAPDDRTFNIATSSLLVAPATITIPAGQTSAVVSVKTLATLVDTLSTVTLSNAAGFSQTASATVQAPVVAWIMPPFTTFSGAGTFDVLVALDGIAPANFKVTGSTTAGAVATVPTSTTVPAGANYVLVKVTVKQVTAKKKATITIGGKSFILTVLP